MTARPLILAIVGLALVAQSSVSLTADSVLIAAVNENLRFGFPLGPVRLYEVGLTPAGVGGDPASSTPVPSRWSSPVARSLASSVRPRGGGRVVA